MRTVTSVSFDELTEEILDDMGRITGMNRSEILRRLVISFVAGHDASTTIKYNKIDKRAVTAWKEMSD